MLALIEPFGVTLGGDTTAKLGAALVAIGVIAAYIQDRLGGVKVQTNPATLAGPENYPLIPPGTRPRAVRTADRPGRGRAADSSRERPRSRRRTCSARPSCDVPPFETDASPRNLVTRDDPPVPHRPPAPSPPR